MDAACWVSWGEGIETPYSKVPPENLLPLLFSFTFVIFFIHWPLSPASSSVFWYWFCFVCSGLTYEIYSGGGSSMYVYCMVCYCVIAAPYVRSVVVTIHTVTLLITIQNALWTKSSLYSLKFFLCHFAHVLASGSLKIKAYMGYSSKQLTLYIW